MDTLDLKIEVWEGDRVVEVMATASHIYVARAAFEVAKEVRPRSTIRLRKGILVLRERVVD